MKGTSAQAVIEIKPEGISREVVDAIQGADMKGAVVVISFKDQALADVKAIDGAIPCALLVGKRPEGTVAEQAEELTRRAKACGSDILNLNYTALTPALVGELKRRGFPVWCWTVNEGCVMAALARWGVEAITTDRPDVFASWQARGFKPPAPGR
jgi:glycerophosphoryl diester phosphodiesterase